MVSTPFPHHTTHPVIVLSSTLIISGIPLPRAGLHQTMADKGAEILWDNIAKVPAIMSDNAAKDVADKMFIIKDRVVQLLKTYEDDFTDEQLEVMATKFVDTCITHTGDLASKKHHNAMEACMKEVIIEYNAATMLQRCGALMILRRRGIRARSTPKDKQVWLGLFGKLWADQLGAARYHTPMKLSVRTSDEGKTVKFWEITG